MALTSPYTGEGTEWLRGNLHTHTTVSDGDHPPGDVLAAYEERGYDFLAVSDHDVFVDPDDYRDETDLALVPAVEVTADGPHLLHLGADAAVDPDPDRQAVLDDVADRDGVAVLAHPNWQSGYDHYPQSLLEGLSGYHGVEIYNGVIERHPGAALATDRWDRLLAAGRTVWGFGNDDAHADRDFERAWTVVHADERSPGAVLDALRAGRFHVSTGVAVDSIAVDDGAVTVETRDADRLRLLSDLGRVQREVEGPSATFRVPEDLRYGGDHSYVRVECLGRGGGAAWTQPAFLDDRLGD
ncbi:MAG: CehA/McbA family metallohydrolase [Halobacteriaceae archaeon]